MPETLERLAGRVGATVTASERARIADLVNQRVPQSVLQAELQAHAGIWEAGALRQLTPSEMTTLLGHIDRGVYLHPTIPNHHFADPGLAEFVNQLHEALPIPAGRSSAIVDVNVTFPSQPGRGRTGPAGEADVILDTAVIQYKDGMRTPRQIYDQYQASLRMFDPVETTTPIPAREIYFFIPVPGSTRGHRMVNDINHALATPAFPGGARTNVFSRLNELVEFVR